MLRKLREMQDEEGFTLIELLVVVIIIGILAAIAIPVFLNQREKAYAKAVESDLRNAAIQVESYFADEDEYPATVTWNEGTTDLSTGDVITVSSKVTLAFTNEGQSYCIEGSHEQLPDDDFYYDSDAGGLADVCN